MTILYLYIILSLISATLVITAGMHSSRINRRDTRVEVYSTPKRNNVSKFSPQSTE